MPLSTTFAEFEAQMRGLGYDEVLAKDWAPHTVLGVHAHPFAARALVVRGEMWLTHRDATRHIASGGTFELDADTPHAERYGAEGATYWVARRIPTGG